MSRTVKAGRRRGFKVRPRLDDPDTSLTVEVRTDTVVVIETETPQPVEAPDPIVTLSVDVPYSYRKHWNVASSSAASTLGQDITELLTDRYGLPGDELATKDEDRRLDRQEAEPTEPEPSDGLTVREDRGEPKPDQGVHEQGVASTLPVAATAEDQSEPLFAEEGLDGGVKNDGHPPNTLPGETTSHQETLGNGPTHANSAADNLRGQNEDTEDRNEGCGGDCDEAVMDEQDASETDEAYEWVVDFTKTVAMCSKVPRTYWHFWRLQLIDEARTFKDVIREHFEATYGLPEPEELKSLKGTIRKPKTPQAGAGGSRG